MGDSFNTVGYTFSTVEVVQYSGGWLQHYEGITSVLWRDTFSTVGDNSSKCGDSFSTVGYTFSNMEVVQYSGGWLQHCEGITSVLWRDTFSTVGDNSSKCRDSFSTVGDNISTVEDNISTLEGIQYSGGRILVSACLVINNDKKILTFLYYDTKFSVRSFSKIQADFVPYDSWTGVLQVQPCF